MKTTADNGHPLPSERLYVDFLEVFSCDNVSHLDILSTLPMGTVLLPEEEYTFHKDKDKKKKKKTSPVTGVWWW